MTIFTLAPFTSLGIRNAEQIVQNTHNLFEACRYGEKIELVLDLTQVDRLYPTGMAAICATTLYLERCGDYNLHKCLQPENLDAHEYITRMGFYSQLGLDVPYPYTKRDPTGRFFEIVEISNEEDVKTASLKLGEIIRANFPEIIFKAQQALSIALSEVLENVFHHAESPVNAIICAQVYPRQRKVEFAIVDCGCGFLSSLRSKPVYQQCQSANQAIRMATQLDVTRTSVDARGLGLYVATELVRRNRGMMFIASDDGIFKIVNGIDTPEHMCYNDNKRWPGAIVSFLFNLDGPLNAQEIYDEVRLLEDYGDVDDGDIILPF